MKKLFFLLSMAFGYVLNANAQTSEIFASLSGVSATASETNNGAKVSVSDSYSALSLGCNHLSPFINDNFYLVIGGKLSYIWDKEDNVTEHILRIKVPASLKLKVSGNGFALEPYAGLNASVFMIHTASVKKAYSSSSYSQDMFSYYDLNHFTLGGHVGVDLCINKFVFGVCYEKDFTNYYPDNNTKWSSIDFKVGLRFE